MRQLCYSSSRGVVRGAGLEPATTCVSGMRPNQLGDPRVKTRRERASLRGPAGKGAAPRECAPERSRFVSNDGRCQIQVWKLSAERAPGQPLAFIACAAMRRGSAVHRVDRECLGVDAFRPPRRPGGGRCRGKSLRACWRWLGSLARSSLGTSGHNLALCKYPQVSITRPRALPSCAPCMPSTPLAEHTGRRSTPGAVRLPRAPLPP